MTPPPDLAALRARLLECASTLQETHEYGISWLTQKIVDEMEKVIRDAAAALVSPAPHQEWQSIETAPKDGTTILLFGENVVTVGGWVSAADQGAEPEEEFLIAAGWWSFDLRDNTPTHWMPLPEPPQAAPARFTPVEQGTAIGSAHESSDRELLTALACSDPGSVLQPAELDALRRLLRMELR
jgi:hypothetical protein